MTQVSRPSFGTLTWDDCDGIFPCFVYAPDGWKFAYMNGQTVKKYMAPLTAGLQAVYTAATPAAPAYWRHADWLTNLKNNFRGGWPTRLRRTGVMPIGWGPNGWPAP
ncbi:MAG TPA: hypothetical protein VKV05_11865 [Terriglobales bacterium]|nr:hypothetical protein [Terriglobales bacterium]